MNIIIILIIVVVVIVIISYYLLQPKIKQIDTAPQLISLSSQKILLNSDSTQSTLINSSSSSVMGLFNIQFSDKTQALHNVFTPILQIPSMWRLDIAKHPTKLNATTARLGVSTLSIKGIQEENITLPDIPLQKWTFISILRDGRRFDIMYDKKIVASKRLEYYPYTQISPLTIGSPSVNGSAIHVIVNPKRINSIDIGKIYTSLTDSNGAPKQDITSLLFPGTMSITLPDLSSVYSVNTTPSNNLKEWTTPYA